MKCKRTTPAPWRTADYMAKAELIYGPNGEELCMRQDGATVGDMQLMAAAPELLKALDLLVEYVSNGAKGDHMEGAIKTAERAISKARGNP